MVLYELFVGIPPFDSDDDPNLFERIVNDERPPFTGDGDSDLVQELITDCWTGDRVTRATMEQVTAKMEELGREHGGPEFVEFVASWPGMVARAESNETPREFLHGTMSNLVACQQLGLNSAHAMLSQLTAPPE
jgi:hypothetical protein